jgi:NADPH:quinone reductase
VLRGTVERVMSYLAEGSLSMKIGESLKMEEAAEAHRLVESRKSTGKGFIGKQMM